MKYLTVSLFHPQILKGGAQYVAKDLHDAAMADPDVDATLLACIDGNAFPQYAKVGASLTALPDGQNEYVLPGTKFDDFYHVIYDPRRNKALIHFLQTFQPDVIHVHHSIWVGLEFLRLARRYAPQARIIYTLHEYIPICHARGQLFRYHERSVCTNSAPDQCYQCFPDIPAETFELRRRNFKEAFALVDAFIAPSEYLRQRFIAWGLEAARIITIPNGHTRARPKDWTPRHSPNLNVFGFFGQFIDVKGIDILLEAASKLAQEDEVVVRIFGGNKQYASEEYTAKIDYILENAPENLKVIEVGPYSRDNIFDLMSTVDWVVVPSVWPETFALVVSEAWDAKRPVLSARVGGLKERIAEGDNGFTFTPGSATDLAALMQDCLGNKKIWHSLVDNMQDEISVTEAWARHKNFVAGLDPADDTDSSSPLKLVHTQTV